MDDDAEFQTYLRGIMKPDTDADFVRRNYANLKAAYLRNGVVRLPTIEAAPLPSDRYAELG